MASAYTGIEEVPSFGSFRSLRRRDRRMSYPVELSISTSGNTGKTVAQPDGDTKGTSQVINLESEECDITEEECSTDLDSVCDITSNGESELNSQGNVSEMDIHCEEIIPMDEQVESIVDLVHVADKTDMECDRDMVQKPAISFSVKRNVFSDQQHKLPEEQGSCDSLVHTCQGERELLDSQSEPVPEQFEQTYEWSTQDRQPPDMSKIKPDSWYRSMTNLLGVSGSDRVTHSGSFWV